jgi:hypothetical protein
VQLGEVDDLVEPARASRGESPSIVALSMTLSRARQVGVEADPELDERRDAPVDVDPPGRRGRSRPGT